MIEVEEDEEIDGAFQVDHIGPHEELPLNEMYQLKSSVEGPRFGE